MEFITNPSMIWLPIVVFSFIIVISVLIGSWNGWKTATYFMIWNIIGFIATIITIYFEYYNILDFITQRFTSIEGDKDVINASVIAKVIAKNVKSIICIIFLFIILFITNLFAFLIYWFFRKKLKKSIFENKRNGISNGFSRIVGASIGIITSFPIGITLVQASTLLSPKSNFIKFYDIFSKGATINQIGNFADGRENLRAVLIGASNTSQLETLMKAISGVDDAFDDDKAKEIFNNNNIDKLQKIVNSNIMKDAAKVVFKNIKNKIDSSTNKNSFDYKILAKNIPANTKKISITKDTKQTLSNLIVDTFKTKTNEDKVEQFLGELFAETSKLFKVE